jgi:hypothetical protein
MNVLLDVRKVVLSLLEMARGRKYVLYTIRVYTLNTLRLGS